MAREILSSWNSSSPSHICISTLSPRPQTAWRRSLKSGRAGLGSHHLNQKRADTMSIFECPMVFPADGTSLVERVYRNVDDLASPQKGQPDDMRTSGTRFGLFRSGSSNRRERP